MSRVLFLATKILQLILLCYVQSIETEELFCDVTVAVVLPSVDDVETLPYNYNWSNLQHFDGAKRFTLDNCNTLEIIIGNDNAF